MHLKIAVIQREQNFDKYGTFCLCLVKRRAEAQKFCRFSTFETSLFSQVSLLLNVDVARYSLYRALTFQTFQVNEI